MGTAVDERDLEGMEWQWRQRKGKNGGERDWALRMSQGSLVLNSPTGVVREKRRGLGRRKVF